MADVAVRADYYVGEQASLTKTISESDVSTFAELIGDQNPIHTDDEYARQTRFGRRVAHGVFTGGLISAVLGNELPGPGAIYLSQQLEFLAPVFVGDRPVFWLGSRGHHADIGGSTPAVRISRVGAPCTRASRFQAATTVM